jgi:hypothetical protein
MVALLSSSASSLRRAFGLFGLCELCPRGPNRGILLICGRGLASNILPQETESGIGPSNSVGQGQRIVLTRRSKTRSCLNRHAMWVEVHEPIWERVESDNDDDDVGTSSMP